MSNSEIALVLSSFFECPPLPVLRFWRLPPGSAHRRRSPSIFTENQLRRRHVVSLRAGRTGPRSRTALPLPAIGPSPPGQAAPHARWNINQRRADRCCRPLRFRPLNYCIPPAISWILYPPPSSNRHSKQCRSLSRRGFLRAGLHKRCGSEWRICAAAKSNLSRYDVESTETSFPAPNTPLSVRRNGKRIALCSSRKIPFKMSYFSVNLAALARTNTQHTELNWTSPDHHHVTAVTEPRMGSGLSSSKTEVSPPFICTA